MKIYIIFVHVVADCCYEKWRFISTSHQKLTYANMIFVTEICALNVKVTNKKRIKDVEYLSRKLRNTYVKI